MQGEDIVHPVALHDVGDDIEGGACDPDATVQWQGGTGVDAETVQGKVSHAHVDGVRSPVRVEERPVRLGHAGHTSSFIALGRIASSDRRQRRPAPRAAGIRTDRRRDAQFAKSAHEQRMPSLGWRWVNGCAGSRLPVRFRGTLFVVRGPSRWIGKDGVGFV